MSRKINKIIIHCTATSPNVKNHKILSNWRKLGWKSNGYHWLIDKDGIATRLQDDKFVSNGVAGHNSRSIHLCYIGGIENKKAVDTRTPEQKETFIFLIESYLNKYPGSEVLGHRNLSPDLDKDGIVEPHEWVKVCPCFDVKEEYKNLK